MLRLFHLLLETVPAEAQHLSLRRAACQQPDRLIAQVDAQQKLVGVGAEEVVTRAGGLAVDELHGENIHRPLVDQPRLIAAGQQKRLVAAERDQLRVPVAQGQQEQFPFFGRVGHSFIVQHPVTYRSARLSSTDSTTPLRRVGCSAPINAAYGPPWRSISSCVPRCTILPLSSMMISSQSRIVLSRCATIKHVHPRRRR